ncbi:hypothetical protein PanWU01x14_118270, partial [Parasponia andersonii]
RENHLIPTETHILSMIIITILRVNQPLQPLQAITLHAHDLPYRGHSCRRRNHRSSVRRSALRKR